MMMIAQQRTTKRSEGRENFGWFFLLPGPAPDGPLKYRLSWRCLSFPILFNARPQPYVLPLSLRGSLSLALEQGFFSQLFLLLRAKPLIRVDDVMIAQLHYWLHPCLRCILCKRFDEFSLLHVHRYGRYCQSRAASIVNFNIISSYSLINQHHNQDSVSTS